MPVLQTVKSSIDTWQVQLAAYMQGSCAHVHYIGHVSAFLLST